MLLSDVSPFGLSQTEHDITESEMKSQCHKLHVEAAMSKYFPHNEWICFKVQVSGL